MIICPKCGSKNTCGAPDEAPAWAQNYTKCFACGKRWDHAGGAPAQDEEGEDGDPVPKTRSGEDIVKLVMDLSHRKKAVPKQERKTMPRCTKGKCQTEAAEDSVRVLLEPIPFRGAQGFWDWPVELGELEFRKF